jgi:hypothetical protein
MNETLFFRPGREPQDRKVFTPFYCFKIMMVGGNQCRVHKNGGGKGKTIGKSRLIEPFHSARFPQKRRGDLIQNGKGPA